VEPAPRDERAWRLRLEERHDEPRLRLRDRYEKHSRGEVECFWFPFTLESHALASLEGLRREGSLARAKRFDVRFRDRRREHSKRDAVLLQLGSYPGRVTRRHEIAGAGGCRPTRTRDAMPDSRGRIVVHNE